ncbi:MAG: hypothetical protein JWP02_2420 [Acidimicrobiales bacterium]|nr:hypothetical protein [Acidimicrobiales bacterium]
MRALAVLALGLLLVVVGVGVAGAQTTAPSPPETATTSSSASTTEPPPTTTTRPLIAPEGSSGGFPAAGEGFPWIPVGVGILVAGLIGSRLRRASRR